MGASSASVVSGVPLAADSGLFIEEFSPVPGLGIGLAATKAAMESRTMGKYFILILVNLTCIWILQQREY